MDDRVKQELKKLVTHNIFAEAMGIELLELRQGYAREDAVPIGERQSLWLAAWRCAVFTGGYYLRTGGMHIRLLFLDD